MANFIIEKEVLELDLDASHKINEIDCVFTRLIEEDIEVEFVIVYRVVVCGVVVVVCDRRAVFCEG